MIGIWCTSNQYSLIHETLHSFSKTHFEIIQIIFFVKTLIYYVFDASFYFGML